MENTFTLTLFDAMPDFGDLRALHDFLNHYSDVISQLTCDSVSISVRENKGELCNLTVKNIIKQDNDLINLSLNVNFVGEKLVLKIFNVLRHALTYRDAYSEMTSPDGQTIIPLTPSLVFNKWGGFPQNITDFFKELGFDEVFFNLNDRAKYVVASDGSVHICNHYLLEYLLSTGIRNGEELTDLTYKVANNLSQFALRYDKRLIPNSFYAYLGKSTKIINESNCDIVNVKQKIFVLPLVYELRGGTHHYTQTTHAGEAIFYDKIRKGEDLNATLVRVVNKELNIAKDYIAAFVERDLEFDRDRNGIITPRFRVLVYVDSINDSDWKTRRRFLNEKKIFPKYNDEGRSWISMEKAKRDYLI